MCEWKIEKMEVDADENSAMSVDTEDSSESSDAGSSDQSDGEEDAVDKAEAERRIAELQKAVVYFTHYRSLVRKLNVLVDDQLWAWYCRLSVRLSVTLCIVAKRYILQQQCLNKWIGSGPQGLQLSTPHRPWAPKNHATDKISAVKELVSRLTCTRMHMLMGKSHIDVEVYLLLCANCCRMSYIVCRLMISV